MSDPNNSSVPPVPPSGEPTPTTPPAYSQQPPAYSPPSGYAQPAGYSTGGEAPKKTLSLISLIGGIAGIVFSLFGGWGILFSIAAVVLGHLGKKREAAPAKAFWLTGLITGYVGIAIALVWIILAIIALVFLASVGSASYSY